MNKYFELRMILALPEIIVPDDLSVTSYLVAFAEHLQGEICGSVRALSEAEMEGTETPLKRLLLALNKLEAANIEVRRVMKEMADKDGPQES